jgi:peptidyl-prolyl isomerase D
MIISSSSLTLRTWCGMRKGCGERKFRECWLKSWTLEHIHQINGFFHFSSGWTSGSCFSPDERDKVIGAEMRRLEGLKNNRSLPLLYMDIKINDRYSGRMKFVLFKDVAPLAAENFRALCTGEKGLVPQGGKGAGKPYSLRGKAFYNIVDRFIIQSGSFTESIYGGTFEDDPGGLALKHNRKGLLSMANDGPNTNAGQFSIMMASAPHLDGKNVIFGEIVQGVEVAHRINYLAADKSNKTAGQEDGAVIFDCGELRWFD